MSDAHAPSLVAVAFVAWHVVAGTSLVPLVRRRALGRNPNLLLTSAIPSRHRVITRWMSPVAIGWFAATMAYGLSASFRATWLGAPLFSAPTWLGWAIAVPAHLGVLASQVSMGEAFRVGLDERERPPLRTGGVFQWSRNPIYVCCVAFLLGAFLFTPCVAVALGIAGHLVCFHALVLEEERVLRLRHGEAFDAYRRAVPRYLPWFDSLRRGRTSADPGSARPA